MKKLFKVVNTSDKLQKTLEVFEKKPDAKVYRDKLNEKETYMRFRVCRGPDHWRGESFVNSKNIEAESPVRVEEKKVKAKERNKKERDAKRKEKANEDYGPVAQPGSSGQNQAIG